MNKQDDSKVPFDISRAPLGLRAASALVSELGKLDDRFERHYLELKSDIDPSKNELAKIAKYILGSANRMPEKASTAFEGYGVMVIGVSPGKITGVAPIEILDIEKVVSAYIGPNGPNWDLIHVPAEGSDRSVLVILIDPPQPGQDAFLCRKEGDNLVNGRIYIRADGETREARAPEVDLLLERGKWTTKPEVSFEVEVLGLAYPVEFDLQRTLELHIAGTVQRLLGALPRAEPEPVPDPSDGGGLGLSASRLGGIEVAGLSGIARLGNEIVSAGGLDRLSSMMTTEPETRTEDEYRAAVERWEETFREAWPEVIKKLAAQTLPAVSVRIRNQTKAFFDDLELRIHLEGDVDGLEWQDGGDGNYPSSLDLPTPPRIWGPTYRSPLGSQFFAPPSYIQDLSFPSTYVSPLDWKNGGSVDIKLSVGKLRPLGEYLFDEAELILVLPMPPDAHVNGTWQITAKGHDDIYTGELQVNVSSPIDLSETMESLLSPDSD